MWISSWSEMEGGRHIWHNICHSGEMSFGGLLFPLHPPSSLPVHFFGPSFWRVTSYRWKERRGPRDWHLISWRSEQDGWRTQKTACKQVFLLPCMTFLASPTEERRPQRCWKNRDGWEKEGNLLRNCAKDTIISFWIPCVLLKRVLVISWEPFL